MNTRDMLVRAVCEQPDEDDPRLRLADWYEEHAELVDCPKCQGIPHGLTVCRRCNDAGRVSNGYAERADFIRGMFGNRNVRETNIVFPDWFLRGHACSIDGFKLIGWNTPVQGQKPVYIPEGEICNMTTRFTAKFHKGFIWHIECCEEFLDKYAKQLFQVQPIESVTLTGKEPLPITHGVTEPSFFFERAEEPSGFTSMMRNSVLKNVFDFLFSYDRRITMSHYRSVNDGIDELNRACVHYGRSKAFGADLSTLSNAYLDSRRAMLGGSSDPI